MAINRQDNGCYQYVLLLFRHTTREGFVATTSYRFPPTTDSLNSAELTILGQRFLISLNLLLVEYHVKMRKTRAKLENH